ncbi:MAG: SDR family oxidoreductase [Candidimonas sp.]|nr:MAG: SDR family oxidoreductase [Candidimonas sp.]
MNLRLNDKRVVVSGGTRGIGRSIVETFLEEGAAVSFCARNAAEVSDTVRQLEGCGTVFGTTADVGDDAAVASWVDRAAEQLGGIDIAVANVSALAIPDTDENWAASLNVDIMGTVRLVKSAMPYLERSDAAAIVAISSVTGREADFASGPYGTAKTAIVGYIKGLAFHLAGVGIRANAVSPGNTFFPGGIWDGIKRDNPELYNDAVALNPTGHMGTPREVADAVVFLCSPRASRISGTNLVVDGALTRGIQL